MAPHEYPRRVLLMVSGLSPQVVTETLYALAVERKPAFVPTEVLLVTTAQGARIARQALFDEPPGRFRQLCADWKLGNAIAFDVSRIRTIREAAGPLEDLRSGADLARAADEISAIVRELCSDPACAVHASIAGGRKSMSYYIGQAMSLFGRPQDRLSHVLVNHPFEGLRDFYYPPSVPVELTDPRTGASVNTASALIELADVPFVRLRRGLPDALLRGGATFSEAVAAASPQAIGARLHVDSAAAIVTAGGQGVHLPPILYAWYLLFVRRALLADPALRTVRHVELPPDELLEEYARLVGRTSEAYRLLAGQLRRDDGIAETFFREKNAKVNRRLRDALGVEAGAYLIKASGRRPVTRYGIRLAPDRIELV